jgi:hypothetical protein
LRITNIKIQNSKTNIMLKEIEELEIALAKAKAEYMKSQTPTIIKPEFEAFEVYHEDLEGHYTWREAKKACAKLGAGWRLPTKEELHEMYEKRDMVGGFTPFYYWSSTEFDSSSAWSQAFYNGIHLSNDKSSSNLHVRAVRALTI